MPFMMGLKGMLELDDEAIDKMMKEHVSFNQYVTENVESERVRKELFSVTQYSSHAIFDWDIFAAGDFIKKILPCLATGDIEIFNGDPSDTAINDAFRDVIVKNGGEIRLLLRSPRDRCQGGKATGVVFHDNNTDTWHMAVARDVITNLPVWLNLHLIDNSLLPAEWVANVREYQKHQGIGVGVWLGLDRKVTDSTSYFRLGSSPSRDRHRHQVHRRSLLPFQQLSRGGPRGQAALLHRILYGKKTPFTTGTHSKNTATT